MKTVSDAMSRRERFFFGFCLSGSTVADSVESVTVSGVPGSIGSVSEFDSGAISEFSGPVDGLAEGIFG